MRRTAQIPRNINIQTECENETNPSYCNGNQLQKHARRWMNRLKYQIWKEENRWKYVILVLIFFFYFSSFTHNEIQIIEEIPCYLSTKQVVAHHLSAEIPLLYRLIHNYYLWPPSYQPYNLTDDDDAGYAQHEQGDAILLALFGERKHGMFVEAGAADGEGGSNTLFLEKNYEWTGLLVEPNVNYHSTLIGKHRKAWISPTCLSLHDYAHRSVLETIENVDQISSIGAPLGDHLYICPIEMEGHSKTRWYGAFKKPGQDLESSGCRIPRRYHQSVTCFPLHALLLAINVTTVDYFSLDVEGVELDVLNSIPFEKIDIKVLQIEFSKLEDPSLLEKFLNSKGYTRLTELTTTEEGRTITIQIQRILREDYIFIKNGLHLPVT